METEWRLVAQREDTELQRCELPVRALVTNCNARSHKPVILLPIAIKEKYLCMTVHVFRLQHASTSQSQQQPSSTERHGNLLHSLQEALSSTLQSLHFHREGFRAGTRASLDGIVKRKSFPWWKQNFYNATCDQLQQTLAYLVHIAEVRIVALRRCSSVWLMLRQERITVYWTIVFPTLQGIKCNKTCVY
jgi:hypothetical protein